jgi:predicted alpha-1,2-mannosidase
MTRPAVLLVLLAASLAAAADDPASFVDPFVGTRNMGHTFPGATVPWGMVQLSPDTRHLDMFDAEGRYVPEVYRYCAGYQHEDSTIVGFSHTHFSGTGHSDLGDVSLMPVVGTADLEGDIAARFDHAREAAEPGWYMVDLEDGAIAVELTATTRTGRHLYRFAEAGRHDVVLDLAANIYDYDGKNVWTTVRVQNDTLVTGTRITTGWARTRTVHFAIAFSRPVASYGHKRLDPTPYRGFWRRFDQEHDFPEMAGRELRARFGFDLEAGVELQVKVGLSAVSTAGAVANLEAEAPGWDFAATREAARAAWNAELGRVRVRSMDRDRQAVFYTALYHALLGPTVYQDADGRYLGLDGNVHEAEGFTNHTTFSLWDTYRALHPLLTVLQPDRNADMVNSMLAHYDQSVHPMLPVWSHHANENWCMIGYHAVSVIADAVLKGAPGIDARRALDACVATARVPYFDGAGEYAALGWVPEEASGSSVSVTVEFAYDDWCIARLADSLGDGAVAAEFTRRSRAFGRVFDPDLGFMRPRGRDGAWREDFDPLATHGQGFIEGNAWTYSLYVPHDVPALVDLMNGPAAFGAHLDSLFAMELSDEAIAHTEDITRDGIIGGYVHGNEPGHHIPYLYPWTDRPWRTQERVRMILDTMYGTGPAGLCGNDDLGQMSAWYVFSALGFYPVCPGSGEYVLGSPLVERAEIDLSGGRSLVVEARDQSPANVYVQRVELDGRAVTGPVISHADLTKGGRLVFFMGPEPARP